MAGTDELEALRRRAVEATMLPPRPLGAAVQALGFVQADPIRAPARAQDLILRHRVAGYRAGDIERRYPRLGLEEAMFYAYGFMPPGLRNLLTPRHDPQFPNGRHVPDRLAGAVLDFVRANGATHPRALEQAFGRERAVNGWGGFSKATTRALDSLQHHGYLRVTRREDGIRVFAAADPPATTVPDAERLRLLVMAAARALSPVPAATLASIAARLARGILGAGRKDGTIATLLKAGVLERGTIAGVEYLWPSGTTAAPVRLRRVVRFLAPFDPLVWDRRRLEHLWGWRYRFEAYTPAEKRAMGYYAMPVLWGSALVGWVNCSLRDGKLDVAAGFRDEGRRGADFRRAFDAEVARMEAFLAPR